MKRNCYLWCPSKWVVVITTKTADTANGVDKTYNP